MTDESIVRDCEISLTGNTVAYRHGGKGQTMVLLHGIASNAQTWDPVIEQLAQTHEVIAPDLIGHGRSDKPIGDYSIGGYATIVRDLLMALDVERVTLVGHSLGGGIAMSLLYMAPELIGRLVLVDSGGLGKGLGAPLRAASLPGAPLFIRAATSIPMQRAGHLAHRLLDAAHVTLPTDVEEGLDGFASLHDRAARQAFLHTVRSSTGLGGQRVSAVDKLYLMGDTPVLTIWGDHDSIIPVQHAYEAKEIVPHMELAIIPNAGHFPHVDDPGRFVALVEEFEEATEPSRLTLDLMGEILRDEAMDPVVPLAGHDDGGAGAGRTGDGDERPELVA